MSCAACAPGRARPHLPSPSRKGRRRTDLSNEATDNEENEEFTFGCFEPPMTNTRVARGWTWIERVAQDVRFAARLLVRRPAFSVTAILTLTLGIGGTTAVFSLLHALLIKNL